MRIEEIDLGTQTYLSILKDSISNGLGFSGTKSFQELLNHEKHEKVHFGKVRDVYVFDKFIILFTTDRQSAFDRQLATVPFKGQVLNMISLWWFEQTRHLVPNHGLLIVTFDRRHHPPL
jgi:hypothetical protein